MTPVAYIRRRILGLSQQDLAERVGHSQPSVSRWETAGTFPADVMPIIRKMAAENPAWSDTLFFEAPETTDDESRTGAI